MQEPQPHRQLAGAGVRTYERLSDAWRLSAGERSTLIGLDRATYAAAVVTPDLFPEHALFSISRVLGLYQAIHTLFPDPEIADTRSDARTAARCLAANRHSSC